MRGTITRGKIVRRERLVLMAAIGVALLAHGCAETPKAYRVGILIDNNAANSVITDFKASMTTLGYVEGANIAYDVRRLSTDTSEDQPIAGKFVTDKVDVVFTFPGKSALVMKTAAQGTTIPIVFCYSVIGGTDIVDSVRSPGGYITGVRIPGPEIAIKSFESMLEVNPRARHIMLIYDPNYFSTGPTLEALRPAAMSARVTLQEVHIPREEDTQTVLRKLEESKSTAADAILYLQDWLPRSAATSAAILKFANAHRIPIVGGPAALVRNGGSILSAATNIRDQIKVAATMADKVLQGAPAGTLSVLSTEPHLYINYTKAQELGLTIPNSLLKQAVEIIH